MGILCRVRPDGCLCGNQDWIGYSEYRTDLPGGRHANVATTRACLVRADGTGRTVLAEELIGDADTWTQFAGWSPDGRRAILGCGWESPENAAWEEEHKEFRMTEGWLCDAYLLDLSTGELTNVTAVERISDYNGGLFFLPDGKGLGFTALIKGVSTPYVTDLNGRNKQDVSGGTGGFIYGYSASPDGQLISYNENYQVYIANADGSGKQRVKTGNAFNFAPRWSPDGQWLLFVSGVHGHSDPWIIRRDGTGLRKLTDLNGYQGWVLFLDVDDFHNGSSDLPAWGADGQWVYFTTRIDAQTTAIMRTHVDGRLEPLTRSTPGTLNYQPIPSPGGRGVCFGSNRTGTRQLYVTNSDGTVVDPITHVSPGWGAMWPHWRPVFGQSPVPGGKGSSPR